MGALRVSDGRDVVLGETKINSGHSFVSVEVCARGLDARWHHMMDDYVLLIMKHVKKMQHFPGAFKLSLSVR